MLSFSPRRPLFSLLAGALALCASAQTNVLNVPLESSRSNGSATQLTDAAARAFARNTTVLTRQVRNARAKAGDYRSDIPFSLPMRVQLTKNGQPLGAKATSRANSINLVFDSSFPAAYRTFLQGIYATAQPFLDATFGDPAISGDVQVVNYDASIGDRDAVAGGYYLPNDGAGNRQIRFPIYSNNEAAAINFLHTVLLAYLPNETYGLDAFNEGLVRAAVMRVVRQRSAVPTLDADQVEAVLENTYDVGPRYDWVNLPSLGARNFIASNLRDTPLPLGGSLGGIYLIRYQTAGSAFQKVLAEHPTFIAQFNAAYRNNLGLRFNRDGLVSLGQTVLNSLRPSDATVEGQSFTAWAQKQFILDTDTTTGLKLHLDTIPITDVLSGEAGAFLVQATYFETLASGSETLLGGASYPVVWTPTYDRVFPTVASDRVDIAGAYGAYAPSFDATGTSTSYRASLDFPVLDRNQRIYLPVGTIRAGGQASANDLYGTVTGVVGAGLTVTVQVGSDTFTAPVNNNAFGINTSSANFQGTRSCLVTLSQAGTTLLTRRVNKGPGPLYLDLRVNGEGSTTFPLTTLGGLQLVGFSTEPYFSSLAKTVGAASGNLIARYNSGRSRFELYPDTDNLRQGMGFFIRSNGSLNGLTVPGTTNAGTAYSVALRPGWNLITNPLSEAVNLAAIQTVHANDFPVAFSAGAGIYTGPDIFSFIPGSPDAASGVPEGGSFAPASQLQPGVGYYVRCLSAEGATLLFRPASIRGRAGGDPNGVKTPFQVGVQIAGEGEATEAKFGAMLGAGASLDRKVDSVLPPGMGGLQAAIIVGAEKRYRDVVALGATNTRTLQVSGLKVGRMYKLTLTLEAGRSRRVTIREGARTYVLSGNQISFAFRATSTTKNFPVSVAGVAQ